MSRTLALLVIAGGLCVGTRTTHAAEVTDRDLQVLRVALGDRCELTDGKYLVISSQPAEPRGVPISEGWPGAAMFSAQLARRSQSGVAWPMSPVCEKLELSAIQQSRRHLLTTNASRWNGRTSTVHFLGSKRSDSRLSSLLFQGWRGPLLCISPVRVVSFVVPASTSK